MPFLWFFYKSKLIQLVQKKLKKHKTEEQIAEDLEETIENITQICDAIRHCKSEDPKEIYQTLKAGQQPDSLAEGNS